MNPNIKFGFSVAQSGQRNVDSTPEVIALTTRGGFRLTPQVSKKLGLRSGDYVMFINNHDDIRGAVEAKADFAVDACNDLDVDINDIETATAALIENYGMWAIARGIQLFDAKGVAQKCAERLSDVQKKAIVAQNFDEALAAAMENEELRDALTVEGITTEEQIAILATAYVAPQVDKYLGSKCANPSRTPGTGVSLNFSDSSVWAFLHGDAGAGVARHYAVDLSSYGKAVLNDGYKDVEVPYLVLGEYTDETPARAKKSE